MSKLSVYVPDGLWEQAKKRGARKGEKTNSSQIVQQALEAMLQEHEARRASLADGAILDRARFDAVLDRVREGAREEFERGYLAGLELIAGVGFDGLNFIVSYNSGDIYDALRSDVDLDSEFPTEVDAEWYGKHAHRFDPSDRLYEAFRAGADRAILDLWNELRTEHWGTDAAVEPAVGEDREAGGTDEDDV